jgi:undecaprenyl-diphosphatase
VHPDWFSVVAATEIGTTGILVGVAVVALLECSVGLGAILPAETVVVAAGAAAANGMVPLWAVFVVAWLAAAAGDNVGFFIGRRWGRQLLDTHGGRIGLTPDRLRQGDEVVERWGAWAVAGGRLVPAVRVLLMPTAGASAMPLQVFVVADLAGAAAWAALHSGLGYLAGLGIAYANDTTLVVGVVLVAALGVAVWWWYKHRDDAPQQAEG